MHADTSHAKKQQQLKWKPKPLGVERIYQIRKDTIWENNTNNENATNNIIPILKTTKTFTIRTQRNFGET